MSDEAFDAFEAALDKTIGDAMRADEEVCRELWSALANVDWYHPEKHYNVGYSFRAAGGMIADRILKRGTYMDWYCNSPYPQVSDRIRRAMKKEGWIFDDLGSICDEPGCLLSVTCGTPAPNDPKGYRTTCSKHAPPWNPVRSNQDGAAK